MTQPYEFSCFEEKQGEKARRAQEIAFEREIASAQNLGREQGFQEGLLEAKAQTESQAALVIEKIQDSLSNILTCQERFQLDLEQRASELALLTGSKLASALIAQRPEQEVLAVIRDCLSSGRDESKIVIQVSEHLVETLKRMIDEIKLEERFEGDIILLADPELEESDCRIEWADGGAERKQTEIEKTITQIIENFVMDSEIPPVEANYKQPEGGKDMPEDSISSSIREVE